MFFWQYLERIKEMGKKGRGRGRGRGEGDNNFSSRSNIQPRNNVNSTDQYRTNEDAKDKDRMINKRISRFDSQDLTTQQSRETYSDTRSAQWHKSKESHFNKRNRHSQNEEEKCERSDSNSGYGYDMRKMESGVSEEYFRLPCAHKLLFHEAPNALSERNNEVYCKECKSRFSISVLNQNIELNPNVASDDCDYGAVGGHFSSNANLSRGQDPNRVENVGLNEAYNDKRGEIVIPREGKSLLAGLMSVGEVSRGFQNSYNCGYSPNESNQSLESFNSGQRRGRQRTGNMDADKGYEERKKYGEISDRMSIDSDIDHNYNSSSMSDEMFYDASEKEEKRVKYSKAGSQQRRNDDDESAKWRNSTAGHQIDDKPFYCLDCKTYSPSELFYKHKAKDHQLIMFDQNLKQMYQREVSSVNTVEKEYEEMDDVSQNDRGIFDFFNILLPFLHRSGTQSEKIFIDSASKCKEVISELRRVKKCNAGNQGQDFASYIHFRNDVDSHINKWNDAKLNMNNISPPRWLLNSWLKNSLGLIVSSSKASDAVLVRFCNRKFYGGNACYSRLKFQGDRLIMPSFKPSLFGLRQDQLVIEYDSVRCCMEQQAIKCFMNVAHTSDVSDSTLVIRINTERFAGRQFVSLCSGEVGRSYAASIFHRSCCIDKPTYHLWAGDYSNNNGSGGKQLLNEAANVDKEVKPSLDDAKVIVPGMVAARYGSNDLSTIFRVYLKGGSGKEEVDRFSFGQVEEGLDQLLYMAARGDVTKIGIKEVGLIINLM